jgi:MFS family permease|tara:strand:+ start:1401 stop:2612 length:1212 start_codon:yes stop_codon:yes gene_type:complete
MKSTNMNFGFLKNTSSLYNKNFSLLFVLEFTIFVVFYMLLPIVPLYILHIGGSQSMIGWILGLAGPLGALFVPLFGLMVDQWSQKKTIALGMLISLLSSLTLIFISSPWLTLIPALLRRLGGTASGTATRTMVIRIAPQSRRGEAMTNFATSHNLAIAIGPSIGIGILSGSGFVSVFISASLLMIIGFTFLIPIQKVISKDVPPPSTKSSSSIFNSFKHTFVKEAWAPAAATFFLSAAYMSAITFISVLCKTRGIDNYSMFFTVYAIVVIVGRLTTGKLSDKYGRSVILYPSLILGGVCMILLANAFTLSMLIAAAIALGLGFGTGNPMLQVIAADWTPSDKQGRSMAMLLGSFSFGTSAGTIFIGEISHLFNFQVAFMGMSIMMLFALLVSIIGFKLNNAKR